MNNFVEIIGGSISILKKTILLVATAFSLFTGTSTLTTNSPIENIIPTSSQETAVENTDKIIGILDQANIIDTKTEESSSDKAKQFAKKLNQLNIVAPNYSILKTSEKNTQNVVKKEDGAINEIVMPAVTNNESFDYFLQNLSFKKQISITTKGADESIVNIRCENKTGNTLKVITGSGVIISQSGLILTAAHVAAPVYSQQNGGSYVCSVGIKDPATGKYPVKIVFIDNEWINKYYSVFDKPHSENGENDIALLQIDNSGTKINSSDLTKLNQAAYSTISTNPTSIGSSITIKAYPSDVYDKSGVFSVLPRKSEQNSIESLFNFNGTANSPFDLIETGPSSLGQSGASGGGIFNDQGQLVGIISNMVSSNILLKNRIRALSIKYIDNEVKKALNRSVLEYNK